MRGELEVANNGGSHNDEMSNRRSPAMARSEALTRSFIQRNAPGDATHLYLRFSFISDQDAYLLTLLWDQTSHCSFGLLALMILRVRTLGEGTATISAGTRADFNAFQKWDPCLWQFEPHPDSRLESRPNFRSGTYAGTPAIGQ